MLRVEIKLIRYLYDLAGIDQQLKNAADIVRFKFRHGGRLLQRLAQFRWFKFGETIYRFELRLGGQIGWRQLTCAPGQTYRFRRRIYFLFSFQLPKNGGRDLL